MSGNAELLDLLKEVSRSFYISVRFLPKPIRMTIAIAYLLARTSDTIADTNQLPAADRIEFLRRFLASLLSGRRLNELEIASCLRGQPEGPEKILLSRMDMIFHEFSNIPPAHRELTVEVLTQITRGQTLDVTKFEIHEGVSGLEDDGALEEYTYFVGGSVGEFWTKVCFLGWPSYARLPEPEMLSSGKAFGKGLQLINILRDFPRDLQAGRCYLPVPNPKAVAQNPNSARKEWERWRCRASEQLEEAWHYLSAVRPWRVRFACAMPILIGIRTLRLLGEAFELVPGIKVSRSEVHRMMLWAAAIAVFRSLERAAFCKFFRPQTRPQE
jgi:farnesyl-diphosphate farnesyltransferase